MRSGPTDAVVHKFLPPPSFRIFEVLFLFSLFTFPFFLGAVNLWSLALGAAFLCGGFSVHWFRQLRLEKGVLRSDLDGWIALYLVFFLLSSAFSKVSYLSLVEFYKLGVVLCAFLATRYLCRQRLQIYRLAQCFVLLGGLFSAVGLLQFVGGLPHDWWSKAYFLSSTYVNHNHFAGLLVLILPMSFGLVLAERDKSKKILFAFLSVLMGVAFIFALSRGALVALVVSMLWMLWVLKKRQLISSSILPFTVLLLLVLGAVAVFGTAPIEQRIANIQAMTQEEELSLKFRWLTWRGTLPMIRHFLLFGSGPGTFGHLFLPFRPPGFSMRPVYTHNDFLHLWAECGFFSFLAMAGLVRAFFLKGLHIIRRDDSRLRIGVGSGVLAGTLGLLLHGLFDFNFHIPANWLLSAVAAGLLFSMDEDRFYSLPKLSVALKTLISMTLVGLLAASLYFGVSNYHFWEAKILLKEHARQGALAAVEKSLSLNPYDAESHYLRGFILALEKDRLSVQDFEEAIQLNPYEPVYDVAKARMLAPALVKDFPERLLQLYQNALAKDPNNAKLAFTSAKDILTLDKNHRPLLRESAQAMLKKAVQLDPSFAEMSFQVLWTNERNISKIFSFYENIPQSLAGLVDFLEKRDLWRYHRQFHLKQLGIDPDVDRQIALAGFWNEQSTDVFSLKDFSHAGPEAVNVDEFFFMNGELSKKIIIHNPLERLVLSAKGSVSKNVYPTLYVKIDGKIVDEYYLDSKGYKNYFTVLRLTPGPHLLSLEYVNDFSAKGGEDRNVWIQRVRLQNAA